MDSVRRQRGLHRSIRYDCALLYFGSRARIKLNPEHRKPLKSAGYITRDPRAKERKKYGQRGARARFQFSKR